MSISKFKKRYKHVSTYKKINLIIKEKLKIIFKNQIKILEFGVDKGISTALFLEFCEKLNGSLYSVDTIDYAKHFNNSKWKFLKCRDDDYATIKKNVDFPVDIIFLDTEHTPNHVEKIFYHYFNKLKKGGIFIIDDISWLPYQKNKKRNNEWIENNNKQTFLKILDIANSNEENIKLEFIFLYSGLAIITKINNKLNKPKKINSREYSLKNILRKLIKNK